MDESLIGLPGADAASESRPEPVVSSDMRAARPESVCGSRSLRRPSISSSPGSVASLYHQRINEKHHGVVWATRKRTCFAESAAPGSHRGTHHTPPPRLERGGYRPRRLHGQRPDHSPLPRGTRCATVACMHRHRLRAKARASTACAHSATTAGRKRIANRREPPRKGGNNT